MIVHATVSVGSGLGVWGNILAVRALRYFYAVCDNGFEVVARRCLSGWRRGDNAVFFRVMPGAGFPWAQSHLCNFFCSGCQCSKRVKCNDVPGEFSTRPAGSMERSGARRWSLGGLPCSPHFPRCGGLLPLTPRESKILTWHGKEGMCLGFPANRPLACLGGGISRGDRSLFLQYMM